MREAPRLVHHLEQHGCRLLREGGNHSIFVGPAGRTSSVPRHTELNDDPAKKIQRSTARNQEPASGPKPEALLSHWGWPRRLDETVARQAAQIAALQKQLEDAKQQVQDIAVKAIEGASGARALSHVNQIAMEQAKTRSTPA